MVNPKLSTSVRPARDPADRMVESAFRTLEVEAEGVTALAAAIGDGLGRPFIAAVELINGAKGRLIVTGMGKSGHIGRKIAATFASTGTPAFFVHPGEASHGDLGMVTADDVIMALSWSGETVELTDLIDYSRRFRIGLIAVTAFDDSTLGKAADVVLALLLERRGFTALDFHTFHPGGRLGATLKFVAQVMRTGAEIPLVPLGTLMADAIVEMTAKTFGCAGITDQAGRLVGIITDGDLRRHMRADLLDVRVDDIMTRAPKTVRPDQLVSEALELINSSKITALMVVEAGKPVGVVHFHDLLRAGVA